MNNQRRKMLVLLAWCLLLMLAWGLWLWHLDASELSFDETATYLVAHQPLWDILTYLRGAVREHPPVYYLLVHGWISLAGASEFSLRLLSVCVGLITLALTGWLARLVTLPSSRRGGAEGEVAGLLAAGFLAITPGMALYARDARMYSLGVAWTVLSAGLFLRDWLPANKWPRRTALVTLAAVHLLALFTHYYLILPILVQPLVLLVTRRWRPLLGWCALHGLPALAGFAWLWLAPGFQMTARSVGLSIASTVPTRYQVFLMLGWILFSQATLIHFRLLYSVLALAGTGALLALWRRRVAGVWLALTLTTPLALAYALPNPPASRYLVFLTPFAALALCSLCIAILRLIKLRWLAWSATFGLALLGGWLLIAGGLVPALTSEQSHYGRTLRTVQAYARPGDGLLFYGPWQWVMLWYYSPGNLPPITTLPPEAPPLLNPDEARPVLENLLTRYERLWVIPVGVDDVDPGHFVEGWLDTHAHAVWRTNDFSLYLPPLPPDAPIQSPGLTFGDALRLEQVAVEPQPIPAGEPLRLTLYWKALRPLENDVRVTLVLADNVIYPIPNEWAAPPSTWPPGQVITDYEGLMAPQGAPPGEYTLRIRVDDAVTGETLEVNGVKETGLLNIQIAEPVHPPILYDLPNSQTTSFCAPDGSACLTLVGYEPGGLRFQQGYPVHLTLHWLATQDSWRDTQVRVTIAHRAWLLGLGSAPIVTETVALLLPPAPAAAPLTQTLPYRLVLPLVSRNAARQPSERLLTLPAVLELPLDARAGPARVTLQVIGPDGTSWSTAEGKTMLTLFDITVEGRPVLRRLPGGLAPIRVTFGDEIELRGYRLEGDPRPGGQLRITYAWYARTNPTAIYAVFNHLLAADGTPVAQADGWPQEGRMLTTQWQPGEYVEDHYTLTIPPDAPPGPYTLYTGLYNAANNERLPASQDGARLANDQVAIPLPSQEGQ